VGRRSQQGATVPCGVPAFAGRAVEIRMIRVIRGQ
jgi:hypothetical protein